jgi:hypothetical protein
MPDLPDRLAEPAPDGDVGSFLSVHAQVMRQAISEDITKQLEAGRDVAYSAVAIEGAASVQRVSAGKDDAD